MRSDQLIRLLYEKKLNTVRPFVGCSEAEIALVEQEKGIRLPEAYRQYLLAVGHYSGRLFQGTDVEFSKLRELQEDAMELIRENHDPIVLPETAFVFSLHQGYEIRFFELTAGENPPVMQWYEGSSEGIVTICASFDEFLSDSIHRHSIVKWLD